MLSRMLNIITCVSPTVIKSLGFGFAMSGAESRLSEGEYNSYSSLAITLGTVAWIAGAMLENVRPSNVVPFKKSASTVVVQQLLDHAAGYGAVNTFITPISLNSDILFAFSKLFLTGVLTIESFALNYYEKYKSLIPEVKREELRFLMANGGAFLVLSSGINISNYPVNTDIVLLTMGAVMFASEGIYSIKTKNESYLSLTGVRAKQAKFGAAMMFWVGLQDIYQNLSSQHFADDLYLMGSSLLIIAACVRMKMLSRTEITNGEIEVLVEERKLSVDSMGDVSTVDEIIYSSEKLFRRYQMFASVNSVMPAIPSQVEPANSVRSASFSEVESTNSNRSASPGEVKPVQLADETIVDDSYHRLSS